ncbi:MAG: peptidase T [Eubacteriales bacterium]|nr:peptidase T [Eubacteriales bacterium]
MFDSRDITMEEKHALAERFMRYAAIGTQSQEGHTETPSTECQRELARLLAQELTEMGASEVFYDERYCYVYATLPSNLPPVSPEQLTALPDSAAKRRENPAPIIGLVAHMDTSDAVSSNVVHPRLIEVYDGNDIVLNEEKGIVTKVSQTPDLTGQKGKMLVTSDGTSVLGADDKAGVTAIMEVFAFYLAHPEYPHGTVRLMFTPDEEVGNGTACYDRSRFAVDYAYTCDGGAVCELEYENFNAAGAILTIHGQNTHPGSAKGVMKNALLYGMEFHRLLPERETPFYTEGYEGFFHLERIEGTPEEAVLEYIIRDHDRNRFAQRKELFAAALRTMQERYGEETFTCVLKDSYYNMAEKILPQRHLIDNSVAAMRAVGVEPRIAPIRGGTDGCRLSFDGIPCPNLGTGAYHYHSRYEYVCVDEMALAVRILARILGRYAGYTVSDRQE